jgi:hypothetical protein
MEIYLYSLISLHGIELKQLSAGTTLLAYGKNRWLHAQISTFGGG